MARCSAATWSAGTTWARSRSTPWAPPAGSRRNPSMPADMRARLGPGAQAELPNLVLAAAGCAGAGRELHQFLPVARVRPLISKPIIPHPHTGDPPPRLAEPRSRILTYLDLHGPSSH